MKFVKCGFVITALVIFALAGVVAALTELLPRARLLRNAERVDGVVTGSRETNGFDEPNYELDVRFTTHDGRIVDFTEVTKHLRLADPGAQVQVMYDPDRPQRAFLTYTFPDLLLRFALTAAVFVSFGVLSFILPKTC